MTRVFRMNPLVSVIIPVYNVEKYLDKCVQSVINQTYKEIEIVLIDDGSPDRCPEMCDEYSEVDNRIKVIHKSNGGLSDARNVGIDAASGEYITFIDSDDFVENNYVEVLVKEMLEYNADISCGKQNVFYGDKIIPAYTGNHYVLKPKEALEMLLYHDDMDVSAWAKLYKKELFNDVRFPEGRLYEDTATTYKLIDNASVITLKSIPIYNYVMRDDSITNTGFSNRKLELIISTKEMTDYISEKYPELASGCNRRLVYAYLSTLTQTIKDPKIDKKITKELLSRIKTNGFDVLRNKRTPKRDKFGIILAFMGYKAYKSGWSLYNRLRKGK